MVNILKGRRHDPAAFEQLFAKFKKERETVPLEIKHLTYDKIRARQLLQEEELERRLGAKKRRAVSHPNSFAPGRANR